MSDLTELTVKKLREEAKRLCLRGYTTAKKADLVSMIQAARVKTDDPCFPSSPTVIRMAAAAASSASVTRPTLAEIRSLYLSYIGTTHLIPKTRNKGNVGHVLEDLLGIPRSSACLDCVDGELKAFPLKRLKGCLVPKESVAVTMCSLPKLKTEAFSETRCFKKLANTLFVPYYREGDLVTFYAPVHFTVEHSLFAALCSDYDTLQSSAKEERVS